MATYVNDLRLKEIATGDESGTWGTSTNTNLELIGEALGYGTQEVFSSDADATTTIADGASDPARAMYFKITSAGSLTATRTCTIAPNTVSRVMFIENATTGSQSIAISQGSGANVTIATGKTAVVYLDGAGSGAAVVDALALVDPGVTDTLAEVLVAGNTTGGTDIAVGTGDDITFADSSKAIFGAGSDLQIYHDGSNSRIQDSGSGNLKLVTDGAAIQLQSATENMVVATPDADVQLYYNGVEKLATTNTGIDITGTVVSDGLTVDGNATFTTTDNTAQVALVSTDADASDGPILEMFRNSSSPADDDDLGIIKFFGENDASEKIEYGIIEVKAVDVSDGTEDGSINITAMLNGTARSRLFSNSTETVFNEGSQDLDFRVESDNSSHALFVQGSDGNVGIGVDSPSAELHVKNAADCTLLLQSGDGSTAEILFGDASDTSRGKIKYLSSDEMTFEVNNLSEAMRIAANSAVLVGKTSGTAGNKIETNGRISAAAGSDALPTFNCEGDTNTGINLPESDRIQLITGGTERVRIDASGNLLVGKTSTTFSVVGVENRADGRITSTRSGNTNLLLNRLSSDGDIVQFYKDGTAVGSIGAVSGDIVVGTGDTGLRFYDAGRAIQPRHTDGTAANDVISLGMSTNRFKDLYLSGGAYLGGTGAANKLEDYEEGTWTPVLVGSTTAGTATFVSGPVGTYTKIGNQVTVTFNWNISAHTGAGALRVTGLPFALGAGVGVGSVMDGNYTYTSGRTRLVPWVSTSTLRLYGVGDGVGYLENTLDSSHQMNGSITYQTT